MPSSTNHDPQLYARSFADIYDQWYGDLDDPGSVVDAFSDRLAPGATILELGSGTGRLASPLARAGYTVFALDASLPMLRQDRVSANRIAGDMAFTPLRSGSVAAVLIAYNTFFNLQDRDAQQQCLEAVGRILVRNGLLVIDVFSAVEERPGGFGITMRHHPTRADERVAIITGPAAGDPAVVVGSHVELGEVVTCRPWRIAYCTPVELDSLAASAGLELVERHADWAGSAVADDSPHHVSWYKRVAS